MISAAATSVNNDATAVHGATTNGGGALPQTAGAGGSSSPSNQASTANPLPAGNAQPDTAMPKRYGWAPRGKPVSGNYFARADKVPANSADLNLAAVSKTDHLVATLAAGRSDANVPGNNGNALTATTKTDAKALMEAMPKTDTKALKAASPSGTPSSPTIQQKSTPSAIAGGANPIAAELIGVQPSGPNTQLRVLLKNGRSTPVNIAQTTKAVLLSGGKRREATITFPAGAVPANGQLEGIIKLAGHDLNNAADIYIPNVLSGEAHCGVHVKTKRTISLNGTRAKKDCH
jgi:hypothetical protein